MKTIFVYTSMDGTAYRIDVEAFMKENNYFDKGHCMRNLMQWIGDGKHFEEWPSLEDFFIKKKDGSLENVRETNDYIFCGLYAATGYDNDEEGDLFACMAGPILVPVVDKDGIRVNVGKEFAGLSSKDGINWYKE